MRPIAPRKADDHILKRFMLSLKVRRIESAIERLAKSAAKEPVTVTSYSGGNWWHHWK